MTHVSFTQDYQDFKANCPLLRYVDPRNDEFVWEYHQLGSSSMKEACVFLHGLAGGAAVFFHQLNDIAAKGYRVISVQFPGYHRVTDWVKGFDRFLDEIGLNRAHIFGADLGGYLAQHFAAARPARVRSLMLSNSYIDTDYFADSMVLPVMGVHMLALLPHFVLKKLLLDMLPEVYSEMIVKQACDFMACTLDDLSATDLAARLTLLYTETRVPKLLIPNESVLILDVSDATVLPKPIRDQIRDKYPGAKLSVLKGGGDFPFLSRAAETAVHILVHMRSCGDWGKDGAPVHTPKEEPATDDSEVVEVDDLRELREERKNWVNPFEQDDLDDVAF